MGSSTVLSSGHVKKKKKRGRNKSGVQALDRQVRSRQGKSSQARREKFPQTAHIQKKDVFPFPGQVSFQISSKKSQCVGKSPARYAVRFFLPPPAHQSPPRPFAEQSKTRLPSTSAGLLVNPRMTAVAVHTLDVRLPFSQCPT